MKKIYLLLTLLAGFALSTNAQTVLTTQQIQTPAMAGSCDDSSTYVGQTVTVRGVVVMDGGLAQVSGGRNVWIQQNGGGAWSGLDVFGSSGTATTPDDILDLVAGDSVEITGDIAEYQGETEIMPTTVTVVGTGYTPQSTVVPVADLNDPSRNNLLSTGEQWEGAYIELQNVTVTSVIFFSGGNRVSFDVADASGNTINVSDRFIVGRLPANGGSFVPPSVGDVYCSLKGILTHSKNNCSGFNGRGYELYPFDTSHYQICSAAPAISSVSRSTTCVTPSDVISICATITDADGISSATLHYAVGAGTSTYQTVAMTNTSGSTWCADIPAQSDGSFVKYYISATDNGSNTSQMPNVGGGSDPMWYWVRTGGCSIYDVQYVPATYGSDQSAYLGMDVTVEGVVTSSAEPGNLGYVWIQEEGQLAYGGINLYNNAALASLTVGQKVTVTGTVEEYFGETQISVSNVTANGTGTISPVSLDPNLFTTYDLATNEAYEGMLITLANPSSGSPIYVVDENPDAPSNFAEWFVGSDQFDPGQGCRIISGRQSGSARSSLNVSYVNDSLWEATDGLMNVGPCVVNLGDQYDSMTGIMQYTFGAWKLSPRNNGDFVNGPACIHTAVEGQVDNNRFAAYPNPATDRLTIEYELDNANATAVLFDLMGREVAAATLNGVSGAEVVNTSNLPAGTYLLNVVSANGERLHTGRIVIAK